MAGITREEFHKFYESTLVPRLKRLEADRIKNVRFSSKKLNKFMYIYTRIFLVLLLIFAVLCFTPVGFIFYVIFHIFLQIVFPESYSTIVESINPPVIFSCFLLGGLSPVLIVGGCVALYESYNIKFRKYLKMHIVKPIMDLYKLSYFRCKTLGADNINELGVFGYPVHNIQISDAFNGQYEGVDIELLDGRIILKKSDDNSIEAFSGLIVKLAMNKPFKGKTIVSRKFDVSQLFKASAGLEKVELEDAEFMNKFNVYSTSQVEARYLLTTSFMERLNKFLLLFCGPNTSIAKKTKAVEASYKSDEQTNFVIEDIYRPASYSLQICFYKGFVYLFIPTYVNFFEITFRETLLNEEKYWLICEQINAILEIVEYFKLDKDLGL